MLEASNSDSTMETIIYKGNQIRKWKSGGYTAYVLNADGDIDEYNRDTLEEAQAAIDKYAPYLDD